MQKYIEIKTTKLPSAAIADAIATAEDLFPLAAQQRIWTQMFFGLVDKLVVGVDASTVKGRGNFTHLKEFVRSRFGVGPFYFDFID